MSGRYEVWLGIDWHGDLPDYAAEMFVPHALEGKGNTESVSAEDIERELNILWAMVQYLASAPQQLQALGQDACIAAAREWAEAVEKEAQA